MPKWTFSILVGLILCLACNPGSGVHREVAQPQAISPTLKAALGVFEQDTQKEASYRVFYRPTEPPGDKRLLAIPEFAQAGAILFVFNPNTTFNPLLAAAIKVAPVIVLVRSGEMDPRSYDVLQRLILNLRELGYEHHLRSGRLRVSMVDLDTIWIRLFVRGDHGSVYAMDPIYGELGPGTRTRLDDDKLPYLFAGELGLRTVRPPLILSGGNFATDGAGTCFTSTDTIAENGGHREQVDEVMRVYFGCKEVVYLEALPGPTTRHVDMFFRVVSAQVFLLGEYEPRPSPGDPAAFLQAEAYRRMERNFETLVAWGKRRQRPPQVIRMKMPSIDALKEDGAAGGFNYRTFLNYVHLVGDKSEALLIPAYPSDFTTRLLQAGAENVFRKAYPNAKLEFIPAEELIEGQGALHCVTIVVPQLASAMVEERIMRTASYLKRFPVAAQGSVLASWDNGTQVTRQAVVEELKTMKASGKLVGGTPTTRDWERARDRLVDRLALQALLQDAGHQIHDADLEQRVGEPEADELPDGRRRALKQDAWDELAKEYLLSKIDTRTITDEEVEGYYEENMHEYWQPGSTTVDGVLLPTAKQDSSPADYAPRNSKLGMPLNTTAKKSTAAEEELARAVRNGACTPRGPLTATVPNASRWQRTFSQADSEVPYRVRLAVGWLEVNDTTAILEVPDGRVVVRICDRTPASYRPLDDVKVEVRSKIEEERRLEAQKNLTLQLRRGVQNRLATSQR